MCPKLEATSSSNRPSIFEAVFEKRSAQKAYELTKKGPQNQSEIDQLRQKWTKEEKSLRGLFLLVETSIEAFAILQLAVEPDISEFAKHLNEKAKTPLRTMEFCKVVTEAEGKQLLKGLVRGLMHLRPEKKVMIQLRDRSPSFFGDGEHKYFQARQCILLAAQSWKDRQERRKHLRRALEQYKLAARAPDFSIIDACKALEDMHFYEGTTQDVKHTDWPSEERHRCYDRCILRMLRRLLITQQQETTGDEKLVLGLGEGSGNVRQLDQDEEKFLEQDAVECALASRDENFLRNL
ncbi:hypothetical protein AAMO2058_000011700 [Amorphochlora amoebiformis]